MGCALGPNMRLMCVYVYIYILGSNARFARAEAYEIISWDDIMGLYYGIILRIILRDRIMESCYGVYYGVILRNSITGSYYGIILRFISGDNITG